MEWFKVRLGLAGILALSALVFPLSASAHTVDRTSTLTAGTSSSVRSTTIDHGTFAITFIAYFGRVTRTSAYLDHVTFKTCPDRSIMGWLMFAYNSRASYRYTADSGRTYFSCGSFTQQVDHTFYGGQANGRALVTVEKRNADPGCSQVACEQHYSRVWYYVP